MQCTVKKDFDIPVPTLYKIKRFLDFFAQPFQELGLAKLFPARESLKSDIPQGTGNH